MTASGTSRMCRSAEARTAFWLEPDKRAWGNLGQDLIQSRHEGGYDGAISA